MGLEGVDDRVCEITGWMRTHFEQCYGTRSIRPIMGFGKTIWVGAPEGPGASTCPGPTISSFGPTFFRPNLSSESGIKSCARGWKATYSWHAGWTHLLQHRYHRRGFLGCGDVHAIDPKPHRHYTRSFCLAASGRRADAIPSLEKNSRVIRSTVSRPRAIEHAAVWSGVRIPNGRNRRLQLIADL